ncbi:MAG: ArnT family glycosyltransferase [Opitutales bacterium]
MHAESWWCPPGRWWPWISLLLLGLATLLPGLATLPIVDRDEPRFAHATVEMIERGEWVVPYFNDEYRFDKPPLTYWWMRLHYTVLGQHEFGARLHSLLAALACAGVLFAWGSRLFDRGVGWWAAAAWLTCLQVLIHGRIALADMPMVLAVLVSQWSLWQLLVERSSARRWWWALWLSQALGFLAKGPIAFFVPLLTWLLFALLGRAGHRWAFRWTEWFLGAILCLGLIAAWGLPALWATEGLFWNQGMERHVVERGFESFHGRTWNPFFYLVIFLFLFPWAGWLPRSLARGWRDPRRGRFLLLWLLAPVILFTFYQTQLPHYILPGYGGALLLIFAYLRPDELARGWFWKALGGVFGVLAVACVVLAVGGNPPAAAAPLRFVFASAALILAALVILQWGLARQKWALLGTGVLLLAVGFGGLGRSLREAAASVELGEIVTHERLGEAWGIGYREPSLVFYTGRFWSFPEEADWPALARDLPASGAQVIVVQRREWRDGDLLALVWKGDESAVQPVAWVEALPANPPPGWEVQVVRGLNLARFSWVELEVWQRAAR